MKLHPSIVHTAALLSLILCAVSCETTPPPGPKSTTSAAVKEGVPGGVFVNTVEYTGRVTSVDRENRKVTLQNSDGKKFTVKAGPEVVNLDKVYEGDHLKYTVTDELLVHVHDSAVAPPDSAAAAVVLAPKGGQPGGLAAATVQITGTVTAIDQKARTATLQFQDGSVKTFPVRSDIDLTKQKVGTKVTIRVTEMIAIRMERP